MVATGSCGGDAPDFFAWRMSSSENRFPLFRDMRYPMFMPTAEREPSSSPAWAAPSRSPFVRLRELLGESRPGMPPISLAVGEPQHPVPDFLGPVIAAHIEEFGRYPMNKGIEPFCRAAADWLSRRFDLPRPLDPDTEVLVLNGTREGLFLAAIAARRWVGDRPGRPAVLMPNPFYGAYAAGALAADCEPVYLPATRATGFLPDLDMLPDSLLGRTVAFYLASPANPQGAVASTAYLARLVALARRYGFLVFSDECYSEIYSQAAPAGMLETAGPDFANVVVFQSLSKRSNLPGLRVGFAAGDRSFIGRFLDLRNVAAPQVPVPAQRVAIAAYADETHVEANRRLYAGKFDLADQIVGDRYGYRRPPGGFFLWLDVSRQGSDEAATVRLWRDAGLRVVPGRYLAHAQADGSNPGEGFIRVAMVQDHATTAEALHRLVTVLG
jgi:N-succinyldiaminopimelate aminotransferase